MSWVSPAVTSGRQPGSVHSEIPPRRVWVRERLRAKGIQVYSEPFPPMMEVPQEVKALKLSFPFLPGQRIISLQGNNSMVADASHRPSNGAIRYAVDFSSEDRAAGIALAATAPGRVYCFGGARDNKPDNWGLGNLIVIDHGNGYGSMYAHVGKFDVPNGTMVSAGDVIGKVGQTGLAGYPHLHFQAVQIVAPLDPSTQTHQLEDYSAETKVPTFPFIGVPFEMTATDLTSSASSGPIASYDFCNAEREHLPELMHVYTCAPKDKLKPEDRFRSAFQP